LVPPVEQVEFPEQEITELSAHSTWTKQPERNNGSGVPVLRVPESAGANIAAIGFSACVLSTAARLGEARTVMAQQVTARTRRNFGLMAVSFDKSFQVPGRNDDGQSSC
jgi:hypothetical protein